MALLLVVFAAGCGRESGTVPPTLSSISPNSGVQGQTVGVTLTGTNFATGATVGVGGALITVTNATVVSSTQITATFAIAANATPGAVSIRVTSSGITTNAVTFSIVSGLAVNSTSPANGAVDVAVNQPLTATFSETLNCATVTASTFTVTGPGGTPVTGAVSCSGTTATFTPAGVLVSNTLYTATLTTGITDAEGDPLASTFVWSFSTAPPPAVISASPLSGATGVPINQPPVSAIFSQAINCSTVTLSTYTLAGPGATPVAGTVACSGSTATFTSTSDLAPNAIYTATIMTGVTNVPGAPLASNFVWSFKTGPGQSSPPAVISTYPANLATRVPINQKMTAAFNGAMDPATITAATFTLTGPGSVAVSGAVTYAATGSVATFAPAAPLAPLTVYTATITTGAENLTGVPLVSNYSWTFTTGAAPDTTQPTILSIIPLDGATAVPINQAVTATFSEPMDPATINATTFTLEGPGGTSVSGIVTYAAIANTATFTPNASLDPNAIYTAAVTTGATDLAGNPLEAGLVPNPWTFTTAATPDTTDPTIISTNPANASANVAINATVKATFSEAMDPATITTSTFQLEGPGPVVITGTVAYDPVNFIATFMPNANLDPTTLYTATITTGAADLSGNPLGAGVAPNPWTFTTAATVISTSPLNGATGVPINQPPISATFSQPINCATVTLSTFTLTGPGVTSVAGTVACSGSTATFTSSSNLAINTIYTATLTTGMTAVAGATLADNYVWSFKTGAAPIIIPAVISTYPANNATGVPISQKMTASFNVAMGPATITAATVTLTGPGSVAVSGVVTYVATGSVATFAPAAPLAPLTVYTATITTGAKNLTGTPLASNYSWTFTTGAAPDTTKPTIYSTIPLDGAADVPINQAVTVTFSEPMDPAAMNSTTFTLSGPGGTPVAGVVTYAAIANTATFTPNATLDPNTIYTAAVTTGATDLAGNPLGPGLVPNPWTFTTAPTPDTTAPTIISTNPIDAAAGVPINVTVNATFSEAMDPSTITTATFQLEGPGAVAIPGTVAYDPINFIATFTPSSNLATGMAYTATITAGATDLAGNPLEAGVASNPWTFTTAAAVLPAVDLGTAATFGTVGGGAGMTNQGLLTVINGDIATTGASTLVTGFHDNTVVGTPPPCTYTETPLNKGTVNGGIFTAPPPPTVGCPSEGTSVTMTIATQAAADTLTAFNATSATSMPCSAFCAQAGELGGLTLAPGIYTSAPGTFSITNGNLTLDAQGNPNAFWVFQMATSLTVGVAGPTGARSVILINGAQAKNVFWHVGSAATINAAGGGTMVGTILAPAAITFSTAGNVVLTVLNGRALALAASVTMVNTVITVPAP